MRKYQLTRDKFLTQQEIEYLETVIRRLPCRDTALIQLAMATGARASELLNITRADLDPVEQSVYIRALKDGNDREIPLKPEVYELISEYIPFNISYQRLDQIWDMYRPNRKKFHSLRHTFAVELFKKKRDIKLVQLALGHRSINTTMVYLDFIYSQEEMRRLIL